MNAAYDCNMLAGPPPRGCFEEASIDDSCTFPVDEGAATFCVGSDVQETAWIAVGVLGAVALALVTIVAAGTVWYTRQ